MPDAQQVPEHVSSRQFALCRRRHRSRRQPWPCLRDSQATRSVSAFPAVVATSAASPSTSTRSTAPPTPPPPPPPPPPVPEAAIKSLGRSSFFLPTVCWANSWLVPFL